ncbi:MAG: toxin-antitoxin system YwqK family antitoxin [Lewinellaceae bacterium]|nr:toxin-antitoxin system YwqK family antitoxin [Lewinellaceae bacterium]
MKRAPVLILFLAFVACQADTEMVEIKNEHNQTERFERRKKDFAKHGSYRRLHEQGYLLEEASYINDTLHGIRKFYQPNGQLERIETFQHGLHHGPVVLYYENGQKQLEQTYQFGVLEGVSTKWYPNGVLLEKVTLSNNEENGPFTEWYENGKIRAEGNYLGGDNEHDTLKLYDTLGQLERMLMCQRGACQTIWKKE